MPTDISWTDETWNPLVGCTRAGYTTTEGKKAAHPGCDHCYAIGTCGRSSGKVPLCQAHAGTAHLTARGMDWTGQINYMPERLVYPFTRWKPRKDGKRRRVFVCSLSDMGHPSVTDEQRAAIYGAMVLSHWNTYQDLTKRPAELARFKQEWSPYQCCLAFMDAVNEMGDNPMIAAYLTGVLPAAADWSDFQHIHELVSISDQATADALIPLLLEMPAAVRGVSAEPLIGPVDLLTAAWNGADSLSAMAGIDWVIVGGESGHGARPCKVDWIKTIVADCHQAGVPVWVKQAGSRSNLMGITGSGTDLSEWPAWMRVQKYPHAR